MYGESVGFQTVSEEMVPPTDVALYDERDPRDKVHSATTTDIQRIVGRKLELDPFIDRSIRLLAARNRTAR